MAGHRAFLILMILSIGCTNAVDEPRFSITTKRDDDKVEFQFRADTTVISVHSPFGISQTVIERIDEKWPDTVTLRLHLKALENFQITNGNVTLHAAVSSHTDDQMVRQWKDSKEDSPLDSKSPFWMEVRMVGKDGESMTTIPLQDGYFEILLPRAFFDDNPKSFTVNWIDFYR
ncbi:MAG: hypothetical protein H7Z17_13355 [Fuerstia sp.]|nr:hypothetical protein [Fuerstiella sp.]